MLDRLQETIGLALGDSGTVVSEAGDIDTPDWVILQARDTSIHCRHHQLKGNDGLVIRRGELAQHAHTIGSWRKPLCKGCLLSS